MNPTATTPAATPAAAAPANNAAPAAAQQQLPGPGAPGSNYSSASLYGTRASSFNTSGSCLAAFAIFFD